MGNIEAIEVAYSRAKDNIVYDSFQTIMIAIVVFLVSLKIYEEYQKQIENHKPLDLGSFWGQIRVYVMVCFIASFSGQVFTLTESVCGDLQTKLIRDFGGDTGNKTYQTMTDLVKDQVNLVNEKAAEGLTFDNLVSKYFFKSLSAITMSVGLLIFKYIYTFFILGRYMWLLMLELVAPIAICLCIHETTRSYFFTWLKNMITCYLLIPMFLLADKFGNEVAGFSMEGNAAAGEATVLLVVIIGIIVKVKMFATVRSKASQLF